MRWLLVAVALTASLLAATVACEPTSSVDHFAIAKELESKVPNPGDYGDPAYAAVAEELQLVQTGDATYEQAQTWLKVIRKGRQDALFGRNQAPEVQEGGFHASVDSAPEGGGAHDSAKGSWTAAGWLPYNNVPVNPSGTGSASSGTASKTTTGMQSSSKCSRGPVTLYGTSWCSVCREARAYLRKKGVSFTDKDVEADASAMSEMKRKAPSATSYPVIDIGGEILPGFSESAIDRKLCL